MSLSLNQVVNKFKIIGELHQFIKRFGCGQVTDIEAVLDNSGDFPMLWIIPQNIEVGDNDLTYVFRVMVFDLVNMDDVPEQEVLSDTARTLIDVINIFKGDDLRVYDTDGAYTDYTVSSQIELTPFTERFNDYVSGWYGDIRIITDLDNNPCVNGF